MSKRSGERCKNRAMRGSTKCRMHGGKSLKGIASPSYRDGRHSLYGAPELLRRYEEGLKDPQLIVLRDEIALVDARVGELLGGLQADDSDDEKLWDQILGCIEQRRKLVETERRRLVDLRQVITVEEQAGLVLWIVRVIREELGDTEAVRRIHQRLSQAMVLH